MSKNCKIIMFSTFAGKCAISKINKINILAF